MQLTYPDSFQVSEVSNPNYGTYTTDFIPVNGDIEMISYSDTLAPDGQTLGLPFMLLLVDSFSSMTIDFYEVFDVSAIDDGSMAGILVNTAIQWQAANPLPE
jgi:hypothetical protein